ncbi:MAG TPA: hypothetical protein PKN54_10365, partial [Candidatus Cloacimonas acidaminovorans]|nr:hypothetical protein [Candidatus Cloacimonas acidaminovorans]
LARLFEEQNQFYDALAAYELISQNDPSPELRERIEDLHLRILNDPNRTYDPRLEQLFSPEELAYLKILDHQGFLNMAKAREKLMEEMQGSELIFSEVMPEDVLVDESELDTLREILEEIEQQAQLSLISETGDVGEYNVQDFLIAMLAKFDKDQKLSEVKLSDLLSLFLEMQSLKNQP